MRTTQPGRNWNASNEHRKRQIIRLLNENDRSFSELHRKLRSGKHSWARATLTICLRDMLNNELSIVKAKGKQGKYTLVRNHPLLAERLKGNLPQYNNLQSHDEKGFIDSWLNIQKFAFGVLLNDLIVMSNWTDEEKLEDQLKSDIEDFVDMLNVNSNILVKMLKAGTLKPERLRAIQEKLQAQVKKEWLTNINQE